MTMELKDFIKKALGDIVEGVKLRQVLLTLSAER